MRRLIQKELLNFVTFDAVRRVHIKSVQQTNVMSHHTVPAAPTHETHVVTSVLFTFSKRCGNEKYERYCNDLHDGTAENRSFWENVSNNV